MKLFAKLENLFSATAFAEAGEHEAARDMAAGRSGTSKRQQVTEERRPARAFGSARPPRPENAR